MDHNDIFVIYMTVMVTLLFILLDVAVKHEQYLDSYEKTGFEKEYPDFSVPYIYYKYAMRIYDPNFSHPKQGITDYFISRYREDVTDLSWVLSLLTKIAATLDLPPLKSTPDEDYSIDLSFCIKRNNPIPMRGNGWNRGGEQPEFNAAVATQHRYAAGDFDIHSWLDFIQNNLIRSLSGVLLFGIIHKGLDHLHFKAIQAEGEYWYSKAVQPYKLAKEFFTKTPQEKTLFATKYYQWFWEATEATWYLIKLTSCLVTIAAIVYLLCSSYGIQWKLYVQKRRYSMCLSFAFTWMDPVCLRHQFDDEEPEGFNAAMDPRHRHSSGDYCRDAWTNNIINRLLRLF